MSRAAPTSPHRSAAPQFAALEDVLARQLEGHRELLAALERKRAAIRRADLDGVAGCCAREESIARRLAGLDAERLRVASALAGAGAGAGERTTITGLAEQTPEPQRSRLLALAAQLRDAVAAARRESAIVRAAAEALSRHMTGLVRSVHATLSRAALYGRRGDLHDDTAPSACIDLKS